MGPQITRDGLRRPGKIIHPRGHLGSRRSWIVVVVIVRFAFWHLLSVFNICSYSKKPVNDLSSHIYANVESDPATADVSETVNDLSSADSGDRFSSSEVTSPENNYETHDDDYSYAGVQSVPSSMPKNEYAVVDKTKKEVTNFEYAIVDKTNKIGKPDESTTPRQRDEYAVIVKVKRISRPDADTDVTPASSDEYAVIDMTKKMNNPEPKAPSSAPVDAEYAVVDKRKKTEDHTYGNVQSDVTYNLGFDEDYAVSFTENDIYSA